MFTNFTDDVSFLCFLFSFQLVNGLDGPRYICETEVMDEVALVGAATSNVAEYASPGNHTTKNANGNIITLTLKNNHIIVETEERAVSIMHIIYQLGDCKACSARHTFSPNFIFNNEPNLNIFQNNEI